MNLLFLTAASALTLLFAGEAGAATFRVEYLPRGYAVFSTFEKPERCEINLYYTFTHEGVRKDGESLCLPQDVPQGKDVQFCKFTHELFVDPAPATKPPKITCTPLQ